MVSATRSAASAARVASRIVGAGASNIANARSSASPQDLQVQAVAGGSRPGGQEDALASDGYRPRVTQESLEGGGVRARYGATVPSYPGAFDPDAAAAHADVDLVAELLTIGRARRAYEASLKVIEADDRMHGSLLDAPT